MKRKSLTLQCEYQSSGPIIFPLVMKLPFKSYSHKGYTVRGKQHLQISNQSPITYKKSTMCQILRFAQRGVIHAVALQLLKF